MTEPIPAVSFEEYLNTAGSLTYTFRGRSMLPMLREKRSDYVTIAKKSGRLKKYDVALYRRGTGGSRYILHRVIGVLPDGYLIRGDNCISGEKVEEERVIGVLRSFHRGKGGIFSDRDVDMDGAFVRLCGRAFVLLNPALRSYKRLRGFGGRCRRVFFSRGSKDRL